jgi:hypothetical protein
MSLTQASQLRLFDCSKASSDFPCRLQPSARASSILVEACLQRNCLATSLGAYHYNSGLPIVVTSIRGKVFTGCCTETPVLLLLSSVCCSGNVYGVVALQWRYSSILIETAIALLLPALGMCLPSNGGSQAP